MIRLLIFILALITSSYAIAQDEKEYAKASLNGLKSNLFAKYISIPFEAYFNLDYGKNKYAIDFIH